MTNKNYKSQSYLAYLGIVGKDDGNRLEMTGLQDRVPNRSIDEDTDLTVEDGEREDKNSSSGEDQDMDLVVDF